MSTKYYRADIDGLRALAVLAVVLNHLDPRLLPGGFVGVDVFFVISGYLITRVVVRDVEEGTFSFAAFYERRIRRLFPALFAMLATTLVAGWFVLLPSEYAATFRGALGTTLFSSNILFWRELREGYFASDAKLNPLLHTWSLAVEEQFYVGFPILVLLAVRFLRGRVGLILTLSAAVSFLGASALLPSKEVAVFFLSPFRAWELLIGGLLTFQRVPMLDRTRGIRNLFATGGLLAVLSAFVLFRAEMPFPGATALVPVLGAAAIIHAGAGGSTLVSKFLRARPLVYVGLISYSLYLWHWPLVVLARFASDLELGGAHVPVLLAASLGLGAASYHFVEQPFRHGLRASRRTVFIVATACSLLLGSASTFGVIQRGFEGRVDGATLAFDRARAPSIPFRKCDGRELESACRLGAEGATPTVLFWGDSHALAWAPALDGVLAQRGASSILVADSACPPIRGAERGLGSDCDTTYTEVEAFLLEHPAIRIVFMAARWPEYFRPEGEFLSGYSTRSDALVALQTTVSGLRERGLYVVVIGPVPTYEKPVPLVLAVRGEVPAAQTNVGVHRARHEFFFEALRPIARLPSVDILDPLDWMCGTNCRVRDGDVAYYRDASHLSAAGAMSYGSELDAALARALEFVQRQPPVAADTAP